MQTLSTLCMQQQQDLQSGHLLNLITNGFLCYKIHIFQEFFWFHIYGILSFWPTQPLYINYLL
jgi:hypothetical protein